MMLIFKPRAASFSALCEWTQRAVFCYSLLMKRDQNSQTTDLSAFSRDELEKRYINLETEYKSALAKAAWYEEQYKLAQQRRYGKSSEKDIVGQMSVEDYGVPLFNEAEACREPLNIEPQAEALDTEDRPKKRRRRKDVTPLPFVETVYELSEEEKVCPNCGSPLHEMKRTVRTEIDVIPAKVQVHRYVTVHYACRSCSKAGEPVFITAKGIPPALIRGSMASASLLADIFTKKFVQAVPFYRQEKEYEARGIPITRNNMCHWEIKISDLIFQAIVNRMRQALFAGGVIHCDETYVEVLKEPDRPASRKSYVWVVTTCESQTEHPITIYHYREGRSSVDARAVLDGYSGYIMCDGYAGYDALRKIGKSGEPPMQVTLVACLVHVRRKFTEALKLLAPKDRKGTGAWEAVEKIKRITHTNNQWKDLPPEERFRQRNEHLKPMPEEFFAWVKSEYDISLPKSKYGQALEYALNQKEKVMNFFLDGRLELNNNMAERAVKPFVIGRKNWMFSNTPSGAKASCIIYSIVETAKMNHLDPYEYLKYVMEKYPRDHAARPGEIEEFLPWSKSIPEYVKQPV